MCERIWAAGPIYRPKERAAWGGRVPNDRHRSPGRQGTIPGQLPAALKAAYARKGMQANGPAPGPQASTPTPTGCWQWTRTACQNDGQPGECERLTSDALHEGMKHPSRASPPATSTAQHQPARAGPLRSVMGPHICTPGAPTTKAASPHCTPKERAAGGGRVPNYRQPPRPPPATLTACYVSETPFTTARRTLLQATSCRPHGAPSPMILRATQNVAPRANF